MPTGCYQRTYSADHLAQNPGQTVSQLTISFGRLSDGQRVGEEAVDPVIAWVNALMAPTETTQQDGTAGRRFSEGLFCMPHEQHRLDADWVQDGGIICGVECDGGFFQVVSVNDEGMFIRTDGIRLSECGGSDAQVRMKDEGAGPTTYRLFPMPADICAGVED